jgi:hypothetical protein
VIKVKVVGCSAGLWVVLGIVCAVLVGCDGGHHHVIIIPPTGDIEGFAYFPYTDEFGNFPVYYDTGNELILVTLYDADDITYDFPLRDYLTDTDGYYRFSDVTPDWYFLTAEAIEYDPVMDITDYYWVATPDFELRAYEVHIWDMYLEYDGSEPGPPRALAALTKLRELGPGELLWKPELESYHKDRAERFREQLRERPQELRLKLQMRQAQPEVAPQ